MAQPILSELTKGLSKPQKEAFLKLLKSDKPLNSYNLGVSISTMRALEKKGLVKGKWRGTMVDASINKEWRARYRIVGGKG